jgi:2',3'-cyclic-nucleotide 2'-phosphodiesterase (5'-nucleotidase family)
MSTITKGKQMVPVLNASHVDVACMGNHDFGAFNPDPQPEPRRPNR